MSKELKFLFSIDNIVNVNANLHGACRYIGAMRRALAGSSDLLPIL